MEKINTLLPTLKTKKRYIAYEVLSSKDITKSEFRLSFAETGTRFFGEYGYSEIEPVFIKHEKNKGVIKVKNSQVDKARAIFSLMKKIGNNDIIVRSVIASGTIKRLNAKIHGSL